ncbi:MAG: hypothetical protein Fues2KO_29200 [Fuerstiella sp.]|jgi:hypothetical protein
MSKVFSVFFGCLAAVALCGCGGAEEETYVPDEIQEPMSDEMEAPVGAPDEVSPD